MSCRDSSHSVSVRMRHTHLSGLFEMFLVTLRLATQVWVTVKWKRSMSIQDTVQFDHTALSRSAWLDSSKDHVYRRYNTDQWTSTGQGIDYSATTRTRSHQTRHSRRLLLSSLSPPDLCTTICTGVSSDELLGREYLWGWVELMGPLQNNGTYVCLRKLFPLGAVRRARWGLSSSFQTERRWMNELRWLQLLPKKARQNKWEI